MMVASVVLPSPGGPTRRTWSSASPRDFAASRAMASCSLAFSWPMNSLRRVGRSFSSKAWSSSTRAAETSRSASGEGFSFGLFLGDSTLGDGKAKRDYLQSLGLLGARSGCEESLDQFRIPLLVAALDAFLSEFQ